MQHENLSANARALTLLGTIYFNRNESEIAIVYLNFAAQQNDNLNARAIALSLLGNIYYNQKEYQKAVPYLTQYFGETSDQTERTRVFNLLRELAIQKDVDLNTKINIRNFLINAYLNSQQYEQAIPYLKETAQQYLNLKAKIHALNTLAWIYKDPLALNQPKKQYHI